jgi:hypothetical protein
LRPGKPVITPLIPSSWRWVGLRRVPYHGRELTYFATRQNSKLCVYATDDVHCDKKPERYEQDVTDRVVVTSDSAAAIALRRNNELLVLIGNVGTQTATTPVNISALLDHSATYESRIYNSERETWIEGATKRGSEFSPVAVPIETLGFRLIELRKT